MSAAETATWPKPPSTPGEIARIARIRAMIDWDIRDGHIYLCSDPEVGVGWWCRLTHEPYETQHGPFGSDYEAFLELRWRRINGMRDALRKPLIPRPPIVLEDLALTQGR